jgi:uncharacterized protein YcfL
MEAEMLNRLSFRKSFTKNLLVAPILGVMTVVMVGCSSTPTIKEMTVRMRDTDDIKINDMRSIVANGMLTAQVTAENKGSKKAISYRFRWLNKNGLQVGGDEAWKPFTIGAGQVGLITGIAPHPSVTEFKFELSSD